MNIKWQPISTLPPTPAIILVRGGIVCPEVGSDYPQDVPLVVRYEPPSGDSDYHYFAAATTCHYSIALIAPTEWSPL